MTAKRKKKVAAPPLAIVPAEWEIADAAAFQALQRGEASASQQKRALEWLLTSCCGIKDEPYRPEMPYDTAYACGKRNVGLQVAKLLSINIHEFMRVQGERVS